MEPSYWGYTVEVQKLYTVYTTTFFLAPVKGELQRKTAMISYKFICRHPFSRHLRVTGKVQTLTSKDIDYSQVQDAGFRYSCEAWRTSPFTWGALLYDWRGDFDKLVITKGPQWYSEWYTTLLSTFELPTYLTSTRDWVTFGKRAFGYCRARSIRFAIRILAVGAFISFFAHFVCSGYADLKPASRKQMLSILHDGVTSLSSRITHLLSAPIVVFGQYSARMWWYNTNLIVQRAKRTMSSDYVTHSRCMSTWFTGSSLWMRSKATPQAALNLHKERYFISCSEFRYNWPSYNKGETEKGRRWRVERGMDFHCKREVAISPRKPTRAWLSPSMVGALFFFLVIKMTTS